MGRGVQVGIEVMEIKQISIKENPYYSIRGNGHDKAEVSPFR